MMRFFVVLSAVAAAFAQLTINTPQGVLACQNYQVSWTGGAAPYILQVQPGGDTSAAALETFTGIAASPYQWHVIEGANTQVFLRLHDNNGLIAESGTFTIQSAGSTTCASSSVTGGTTNVGTGSSSSPAAAPPASSASTPAVVVGGTTTTPAPAGSSSGSGSSSSHTTSSTSTTSHNGASAAHVAGGLVGLVGAVAVALAA